MQFYKRSRLSALGDWYQLRLGDADVIVEFHKDGSVQATRVEHDLIVLLDKRISQHLKLVAERKRRNRPDDASRQRLSLFARRERDTIRAEVTLDSIEVNATIARHIRKAIDIFLARQTHLQRHRLDGLFDSVAANLGDEFRPPFGFVFDDAIRRALGIKQRAELFVDVGHKNGVFSRARFILPIDGFFDTQSQSELCGTNSFLTFYLIAYTAYPRGGA